MNIKIINFQLNFSIRSALALIQAVLCVLSAVALIVAALLIYFEGSAAKASDPMADVYTVEAIAGNAVFVLPVIAAAVFVTIICAVKGVKGAEIKRAPGAKITGGADTEKNTGKAPVRKNDGKVQDDKNTDGTSLRENVADASLPASTTNIIRIAVILMAIILIIIGIFNGSFNDVFIKASKICTECIGLG